MFRPSLFFGALVAAARAANFHAGHLAVHVTRLHRYDHSGLQAMLEAEAQWHADAREPTDRTAKRMRGAASFLEQDTTHSSSSKHFLRLSRRQGEALRKHHQDTWPYVSRHTNRRTPSAVLEGGSNEKTGLVHRHGAARRAAQSEYKGFSVTGLSNLDSQYVGPVGVGTRVVPTGCKASSGKSLLYLPADKANAGVSTLEKKACHAEDQSQVWVVLDTGSTNIWVSSDLCKAESCTKPGRRRYDHTESETYQEPPSQIQLNIQFGTGKISGPQGIEDFHVGPFTVYNQTFGMIQQQEGRVFDEVPFEGILGLAFPAMSANGVTPFFDNVVKQHALQRSEFGFYFSLDNPASNAAFWGGVDPVFHKGKIEYFNVTEPYYWSLKLLSFKVGNETLAGEGAPVASLLESDGLGKDRGELKAIVDTGTTFFTAEDGVYEEVMRRIPPKPCSEITEESHPVVTFRLQSASGEARDFALNNTQYMTSAGTGKSSMCNPAFMRINIPSKHGPAMVLGEVFLRHYFSVFDRSEGTHGAVGLALAAHGTDVDQHLKNLTRNQPAFAPDAKTAKKMSE
jgi:pepsin A